MFPASRAVIVFAFTMRLVLSHHTALEFWLSSLSLYKSEFENAHVAISPVELTRDQLHSLRASFRRSTGVRRTLDLLVGSAIERTRLPSSKFHVWNEGHFPEGAIVPLGNGLHVVSPELCYLQMARTHSGLELARIGTDLCSLYAYPYNLWTGDLLEREPVTSRDAILDFLDTHAAGLAGAKEARRCAGHIIERTRSPRESTLSCLLSAPARMGGQALAGMEANAEIPLSAEGAKLTTRKYLEVDLYWPKKRLGVEYNSHLHDTNEAAYRDLEKITTLNAMGTTIVPLNTEHMNSYESFQVVVRALRRQMGLRDQETARMDQARRQAHARLLESERRLGSLPSLTDQAWWQVLLPTVEIGS